MKHFILFFLFSLIAHITTSSAFAKDQNKALFKCKAPKSTLVFSVSADGKIIRTETEASSGMHIASFNDPGKQEVEFKGFTLATDEKENETSLNKLNVANKIELFYTVNEKEKNSAVVCSIFSQNERICPELSGKVFTFTKNRDSQWTISVRRPKHSMGDILSENCDIDMKAFPASWNQEDKAPTKTKQLTPAAH